MSSDLAPVPRFCFSPRLAQGVGVDRSSLAPGGVGPVMRIAAVSQGILEPETDGRVASGIKTAASAVAGFLRLSLLFHRPPGAPRPRLVGGELQTPPHGLRLCDVEVDYRVVACPTSLPAESQSEAGVMTETKVYALPTRTSSPDRRPASSSASSRVSSRPGRGRGASRKRGKDWPGRSDLILLLRRTAARRRVSATPRPFR